jgi:hypothetical protein
VRTRKTGEGAAFAAPGVSAMNNPAFSSALREIRTSNC